MDRIERINDEEFSDIASRFRFNREKLTKDYFITVLLYLMKDIAGIYFKGGTALQKVFLNDARLSEDIDFSLTQNILLIKNEILGKIEESNLFIGIKEDKNVEGFLRLIAFYTDFDGKKDKVFIDLNKRAKLLLKPEEHEIKHFYEPFIPKFSVRTLAKEEMVAEKVAAAICRNKPRDHFDIYKLIKAKIPINLDLVKKKCTSSGTEFSITKMFNKAKALKNRWDRDMAALLSEPVSFQEVIQFLAKYFKLKEEKEKKQKSQKN